MKEKQKKEEERDFFSKPVVIGGKIFSIFKFLFLDNKENRRIIVEKIKEKIENYSKILILEQTGKWEIYKGKSWLKNYCPPKKTKKSIFFPQGTISSYFGFGKDEKKFYLKERRGIEFANQFQRKDYNQILSACYGQFLDSENLQGLATSKETGLRHFTVGVYEKMGRPYFFAVRSEKIEEKVAFLKRKDFLYFSSSKKFLRKFLKEPTFLIKNFAKGEFFEQPL